MVADSSQQREAAYYLALAEQARREMFGPRRRGWLERLEQKGENLRAALQWFAQCEAAEYGLRLAIGLREFWNNGHEREGQTWLTTFLILAQAGQWPALRAQALDDSGALAFNQGEVRDARALFEESIMIRRALGDKDWLAVSLIHLGNLMRYFERDAVAARVLYEECLTLFREVGNRVGIAYGQLALGQVAREEGDYSRAVGLLKESLSSLRDADEVWAITFALSAFAHLAMCRNQPEQALHLAGAGAALRTALGVHSSSVWEAWDKRLLEPAWQALDKEAGAAAWAEGQEMTLAQAVAYALEVTTPDKSVN